MPGCRDGFHTLHYCVNRLYIFEIIYVFSSFLISNGNEAKSSKTLRNKRIVMLVTIMLLIHIGCTPIRSLKDASTVH